MSKKQEKEIEELSQEQQLFNLEELITKGKEAKIPYEFKYPNTDKTVGVQLRPLTSDEFTKAVNIGRQADNNFLTEILKIGLFDLKGEPVPEAIIKELPAGVVTNLVEKINEISGLDLAEDNNRQQDVVNSLLGF